MRAVTWTTELATTVPIVRSTTVTFRRAAVPTMTGGGGRQNDDDQPGARTEASEGLRQVSRARFEIIGEPEIHRSILRFGRHS